MVIAFPVFFWVEDIDFAQVNLVARVVDLNILENDLLLFGPKMMDIGSEGDTNSDLFIDLDRSPFRPSSSKFVNSDALGWGAHPAAEGAGEREILAACAVMREQAQMCQ